MKKTSLNMQKRKRTVCGHLVSNLAAFEDRGLQTYLVCVIQVQDETSALINLLVAGIRSSHGQSRKHMNVVTCEVQRDQSLE